MPEAPATRRSVAASGGGPILPAIIADAGERASKRFIEFFTATIRNPNTRRAYAKAVSDFLAWAEGHGLTLAGIDPVHVAAYIEALTHAKSAPTVKQHLAAIGMLFDWLTTGGIISFNPAASVRGPRHVVKRGKTPVLTAVETRQLLDSIRLKIGPPPKEGEDDNRPPDRPMDPNDALRMIKRRAKAIGLPETVCNHTFRATGITAYLENGGTIENAQAIANHESPKTTKLYDRTGDQITLDEVEIILI